MTKVIGIVVPRFTEKSTRAVIAAHPANAHVVFRTGRPRGNGLPAKKQCIYRAIRHSGGAVRMYSQHRTSVDTAADGFVRTACNHGVCELVGSDGDISHIVFDALFHAQTTLQADFGIDGVQFV